MANDAYNERVPLLQACLRGVVENIHAVDANEPDPVASLKARMMRSTLRDLDKVGIEGDLAARISRMVVVAVRRVLDASDVSLDDKTAVALMAERTMCGVVAAIIQHQQDADVVRDVVDDSLLPGGE